MKRSWYIAVALPVIAMGLLVLLSNWNSSPEPSRQGSLRIVSLSPSVTEMLFALDLGDSIIGATNHCDYPAEAKEIPRVGGLGTPNVEKLLAMSSDLVIATNFKDNEVPEILRDAGIGVLELKINSFQEMFDAFETVGEATGKPQQAKQLVATMQSDLAAVSKRHEHIPISHRPRVFFEIWNDPITTVGGTTFVDELITRAGGVNVSRELDQPYPCVSPGKVIAWNPDVIVLCYMGQTGRPAAEVASRIGWGDISAVRKGQVIDDILHDHLLCPGPRLVEGVKDLARRFSGSLRKPFTVPATGKAAP